jgi:transposase
VKLHPGDMAAVRLVALIDRLFAIDGEARQGHLDCMPRATPCADQKAPALLEEIKAASPRRTLRHCPAAPWAKPRTTPWRYGRNLPASCKYPELELSNNLAENSMRPVAIGRKNWIHVGSQQAGPKVAAILSIVETCRRIDISLRDYLAAVLPGLANTPVHSLLQLTPTVWAAKHHQPAS